jgi:hypothetical protein
MVLTEPLITPAWKPAFASLKDILDAMTAAVYTSDGVHGGAPERLQSETALELSLVAVERTLLS